MTTPSPAVLAAAEEIELRVMRYNCTRESLCEIIQTAIDTELAQLMKENVSLRLAMDTGGTR